LKSKIGHISLVIAVGGLILTEVGIYSGFLQGGFWRILATGFEAGTIGALADWFAVSALFHRIPIPIISRHTNIIVKNRQKMTEAIVELVTTKWLSSEVIHQKLQGMGMAKGVFALLEKPRNLGLSMDFIRYVLRQMVVSLDSPRVVLMVRNSLRQQADDFDIAAPLGGWLQKMVLSKGHHPMVDRLLKESSKALDDPTTREMIQEKLKEVLTSYEKHDFIKKAAVRIGKWTGGIDVELLADRLLHMAREMADDAGSNPDHPLRQKLDQTLLALADNLREGDPSTLALINNIKQKLLKDRELQAMFYSALTRIKYLVEEQVSQSDTEFMNFIQIKASNLINKYGKDEVFLLKMDHWLKDTIAKLVNKYHHELGSMVRESLLRLDDQELVWQIKEKVGDDLQYIRLNGAVVGGLVGIIIALLRLVFL